MCVLYCIMRILNWNVRGLGEDDKCSLVRDTITSCCPSVICLQETKLSSVSPLKLRAFLPMHLKEHVVTLSDGTAGGVLVAWDPAAVMGQVVALHKFHVTVRMSSTTTNTSFLLTTVYAPCLNSERPSFFDVVSSVVGSPDLPWVVLGDFNMYRYAHEKSRGQINWNLMECFNAWIRGHGLDDVWIDNRLFTWSKKRDLPTLVRLDRVLVNAAWNLSFL
uniref:Endonuclease/exonuclease/phosphatase domain-containing protein n=1 Tax=Triticum urartu TaxID=4572 RepID=A0A8R7VHU8_TRIUA